MPQDGDQVVLFNTTLLAQSPYRISEQSLVFELPSSDLLEHSKPSTASSGAAKLAGLKLRYTGQKAGAGDALEQVQLRYKNSSPFLHIVEVDRDITVRTATTRRASDSGARD